MVMQSSALCAPPEQTRPRSALAPFPPRFIRLRDAPSHLGMDKNRFNREVRPLLSAIPIGTQGIAFDRLDLDTWPDDYKSCNGHSAAQPERGKLWETKERRAVGAGQVCRIRLKVVRPDGFEPPTPTFEAMTDNPRLWRITPIFLGLSVG
jgi:hypothetical protein